MGLLAVRVSPRAKRPGIGGWTTGQDGRPCLEIRVAAAPTDGAANAEVLSRLARALGLPRSSLTVAGGGTSRTKRIALPIDADEVRARLGERKGGTKEKGGPE